MGPARGRRTPHRNAPEHARRTPAPGALGAAAVRAARLALLLVTAALLALPGTATAATPAGTASATAALPGTATAAGLPPLPGAGTAGASAGDGRPARVVVVGVPGLLWSDLDPVRTPNLWRLTGSGGAASLSTRANPPRGRGFICPVEGWLTASAGQRAGTSAPGCSPPPVPQVSGEGAVVPGWAQLVAFNADTSYKPVLGQLGQLVADAGGKVAAAGPGAALGAADKSGKVAKYAETVEQLGELTPYRLVVVEAGDLTRAWLEDGSGSGTGSGSGSGTATGTDGGTGAAGDAADTGDGTDRDVPAAPADEVRREAVAGIDRQVGAVLDRLPPDSTLLLGGLSDASDVAHLHVAIASGPSPDGSPYPRGYLTAASTRQNGLVTTTDLTATAIALLGLETPKTVVGRPWTGGDPAPGAGASGGEGDASGDAAEDATAAVVADLARENLASRVVNRVRGPFFGGFVAVQILFYLLAAAAIRRGWGGARALTAVRAVAAVSGSIAVATFLAQLVPWWAFPVPMAGVVLTILGIACAVAALAFAGPWRSHVLGPLAVVAGITSLTLLADVMTGSTLQVNAVTGYEPVAGGRFYGFGNIAFAVYSAGTILALAGIAQWLTSRGRRGLALAVCALYGGLAVFADGWPGWGADFGGVPAFLTGLAVFLILLSGRRVSAVRLGLVGLAGIGLITAIAVADRLRPAGQRTHLGAFVQQVLDGEAGTVIARKFTAMVGVTVGNWSLTLLTLVALAFLFLVLDRPSRWGAPALGRAYALAPALRAGLIGALTCALIGFLMNDSGIAIPAMALTVAVPLTLAACVRALRLAPPTTAERPSEPAGTTAPPAA
ncbi:hypothetical protein Ppa06_24260 [Planomonospora parontospora subsp. parontospora]|uniref:Uncharacterized protein n=2 Tax=Planomonospora parontospora TaxID=58119 RepID=A0AA37BF26_9ACTN|nr:hypothetical protein [Planomonospora parontospora]GGK61726.1 hypothetical protein GCM10010126_21420 [Planomonospora parontospora]GII08628.1 hypothetical protein Ppa06_24260 [Planomonospora parontospora subsp. parontospora]